MGLDYFWHMRKFNRKRLTEVTQDERDINGKVAIVTGSNAGTSESPIWNELKLYSF